MAETTVDHDDVRDEGAVREWLEQFLEAWHSHDPDRLPSLCTDDVLWEDPFIQPSGVAHGKEEVRAWLASIFRAIPTSSSSWRASRSCPSTAPRSLRCGVAAVG